VIWLAVACNFNYPPDLPLDGELTRCADTSDCVVVELGVCDACNGGTVVAVNGESEAFVRRRFSERRPFGHACTLMGCADPVAACEAGTCVITAVDSGPTDTE
jgi:hypothetical protein